MSVLNTPFPTVLLHHFSLPPQLQIFSFSTLLESFKMGMAIDEGKADAYLGTVGLPKVNAFQGMSLKELTINYSKVSVLSLLCQTNMICSSGF
jgi:hypothetical protein